MLWAFLGIILGTLLGLTFQVDIPEMYTRYLAVSIIGILDSLIGAIKVHILEEHYSALIFLSGLILNILLAISITYLGDRLGIDLYLSTSIVFTFRIFNNISIIKRSLLQSMIKRYKMYKLKRREGELSNG